MMKLNLIICYLTSLYLIEKVYPKPIKPKCDAKGNSFINQMINTTSLDNLVQQQFISIQRNRYRNNRDIFPVNQTPLITNISSINTANFKQFAETMISGDDRLSKLKTKSFFILQVMEYIDKELLYSKTLMKITFSLQAHKRKLRICAKAFGKNAHSGSCDFDAFPGASLNVPAASHGCMYLTNFW